MNKGTYGFPIPPAMPTRIAPPEWRSHKLISATTSSEVVPNNVWQMLALVWGGGAAGGSGGGGGGGFAMGIIDVVPGQILPTLTVGALRSLESVAGLVVARRGSVLTTVVDPPADAPSGRAVHLGLERELFL